MSLALSSAPPATREASPALEPIMAGAAIVGAMLIPSLLVAWWLDDRLLSGVSVWVKPLKFAVALTLYCLTLAWFASWLPARVISSRPYRGAMAVAVFCIAGEMIWIVAAAHLGIASHFNVDHRVMRAVYGVMGVFAAVLTAASLVQGVLFLRDRQSALAPAFRLSLGLGLVSTFGATVIVASYMAAGTSPWVGGVSSNGAGLPVFGWSREVGDLRVAHFLATHALHVVPAAGWLLARFVPGRAAERGVVAVTAAYLAVIAAVFIQALAGLPLLSR